MRNLFKLIFLPILKIHVYTERKNVVLVFKYSCEILMFSRACARYNFIRNFLYP